MESRLIGFFVDCTPELCVDVAERHYVSKIVVPGCWHEGALAIF